MLDDHTKEQLKRAVSLNEMIAILNRAGYDLNKPLGLTAKAVILSKLPSLLNVANIKKK